MNTSPVTVFCDNVLETNFKNLWQNKEEHLYSCGLKFDMTSYSGPSPKYLSYLTNYQINLGDVDGSVDVAFITTFMTASQNFYFHMRDDNNCINAIPLFEMPVSKYELVIGRIHCRLIHDTEFYDLSLPKGLTLKISNVFNERGHEHYDVHCPSIILRVVTPTEKFERQKRVSMFQSGGSNSIVRRFQHYYKVIN